MGLVLLGGGGHAVDVLNLLERLSELSSVHGYLDDVKSDRMESWGVPHLGGMKPEYLGGHDVVLAVGMPGSRQVVLDLFQEQAVVSPSYIDPAATVGWKVILGAGAVLLSGARLSPNVVTGRHCYISHNTSVGHDSVLGDNVAVMPGANVSGDCHIGSSVMIGTGACVLQGVSVGERATIGAGAVVTRPVAAGTTVVGSPAKVL